MVGSLRDLARRTAISLLVGGSVLAVALSPVQAATPSPKSSTKASASKSAPSKKPSVSSARPSLKTTSPKKKVVTSSKASTASKKPATATKKAVTAVKKPVATTKKSVTASKKSTPRKIVRRSTAKRVVTPLASPSPKWPPKGFSVSDGIYAKVPSGNELISIISAQKKLALQVQKCETNACGAVLVASSAGCLWWEVDSSIYGPSTADPTKRIEYGTLRTTAVGTKAKEIATILLISSEPLASSVIVGNIAAKCWSTAAPEKVPNNTYIPNSTG